MTSAAVLPPLGRAVPAWSSANADDFAFRAMRWHVREPQPLPMREHDRPAAPGFRLKANAALPWPAHGPQPPAWLHALSVRPRRCYF